MKKQYVLFMLLVFSVGAAMAEDIPAQILAKNSARKTLVAPFEEVKALPKLKKEVHKAGMLYFAAPAHLAMRYTAPEGDMTLIEGDVFQVRREGKVRTLPTKQNNSVMTHLRNTLIYGLQGDVQKVAEENEAEMACSVEGNTWVCILTRQTLTSVGYNRLELTYDKADGSLRRLCIVEGNGNTMTYSIHDVQCDEAIADSVWKW